MEDRQMVKVLSPRYPVSFSEPVKFSSGSMFSSFPSTSDFDRSETPFLEVQA